MNKAEQLHSTYSVFDLLVNGSRFVDDYDEEAAVKHYLRLHPEADEAEVRDELEAELAKRAA